MSEVEIPSPPLSILQEPEEVSEKGAESDEARADPLTSEPKASFDIDESLRSAIGHLAGNYPCVYDNTKGNMFVGSQEVVFVGWTFFFEKRVEIKWINVLRVVKTESVGGSCISFVMRTSDQQYDFSSIANSERVWATLVSIHNKVLHDAPTRALLTTTLRASLRRMSSDPLSNLPTIRIADGPTGMEAAYVAAATIANMDDLRCLSPTNAAASAVARRQSLMQTHIEDAAEVTPDLEEAWRELQQGGGKVSYATSAIQVSAPSLTFHVKRTISMDSRCAQIARLDVTKKHQLCCKSRILFSRAIFKTFLIASLQIRLPTHSKCTWNPQESPM
jgi:hypothetical protein